MGEAILFIAVLFSAMVIHEYAHGWVAYKLGDPTAKEAGRLTLNPLKHIDMVGTVYLPGALILLRLLGQPVFVFGWAKPVPVDFSKLRNPQKDILYVGLAGPLTNVLFAVFLWLVSQFILSPLIKDVLLLIILVNMILAIFNLIPIPPLDGSRVVMGLLPRKYLLPYVKLERYGMFIVIGLLYFLYAGPLGNLVGQFILYLEKFLGG